MRQDGEPEIAVCCRPDGTVTAVLRDDLGLTSTRTGRDLATIAAPDERCNMLSFLHRIIERGAAVDHEIGISSPDRGLSLFFYGCNTAFGIVVIGSSKSLSTLQLCDEFIRMAGQKEKAIRNRLPRPAPKPRETEPQILSHGAELARLHNELVLAQRELIEKSVGLEKQKAERSQELGMAVHGLRNPASSILSAAEYLIEDAANVLTEEQMTLLHGVALSGLFILRMIENVLDFSKFECGKLTMNFTPADLISLVKEVVILNQPQAERRGVRLGMHFESPALIMDLDTSKIIQVIDNLVSNAIKFSPPGGKIEIQTRSDERFASISIRDEGQGISEDLMKTIFDPFRRGRNGSGFDTAGTGLGLAVSKRMIELHSGTIDVQTQLGKGSVFTIHLPKRINARRSRAMPRAKKAGKATAIHGYSQYARLPA